MRIVSPAELADLTARCLGISALVGENDLLKPALRRGAFLLAPCSAADLLSFVAEPLRPLGDFRDQAEDALTELIAYGDILEMKRLGSDPWGTPAITLRPAPPSFVMRGRHEAIIIGVSGDLPSPLTDELAEQVTVEGPVRVLRSDIEHLDTRLKLLGLAQLSEHVWMRTPVVEMAQAFVDRWVAKLDEQPETIGRVDGLEILDPAKSQRFYPGRWRPPVTGDNGVFVAKRAQVYGAKLWSFVRLRAGGMTRLIDIHSIDDWQRSCDIAWRLQAAIDAAHGKPQQVGRMQSGVRSRLAFSGPIPSFAERRLALAGIKTTEEGSLFAFEMDGARVENEIASLRELLWMKSAWEGQDDSDST